MSKFTNPFHSFFSNPLRASGLIVTFALLIGLFAAVQPARAATFTVTNTGDSGAGSLRQAIDNANALAGDDIINFSLSSCPCTITLTSGELSIGNNGSLTINGLGAKLLSVSGNHQSSVFFIQQFANAAISDITITAGSSSFGGGIGTDVGGLDLTLTRVTISGNLATIRGGGISNNSGSRITLNNSTISDNSATSGGGITTSGGHVTLNNSTISGNSAIVEGGGIWNSASITLNSSTLSGNSAAVGGGIFIVRETRTTLNNTIVANSTGGDCFNSTGGGQINASYSLIEDGLGCVNGTNSNNLTGDPLLGPLQYNGGPTQTHALLASSIAIDAGNSTLPIDQRGFSRPVEQPNYPNASGGNGSDIGSFEAQAPPTTKEQCKNGGWKDFTFPSTFKNQGDCIQFVNTGK
jgi:hypothetical protein